MPPCFAAGANPGAGWPFHASANAVSPMAKTSDRPGTDRSDPTFDAARPIGFHPQPTSGGRSDHAGRPQDGAGRDALAINHHAIRVDTLDTAIDAHFYVESLKRSPGKAREPLAELRQHSRPSLHQQDAR